MNMPISAQELTRILSLPLIVDLLRVDRIGESHPMMNKGVCGGTVPGMGAGTHRDEFGR